MGCELTLVKTGCQKIAPHHADLCKVLTCMGLADLEIAQDSCHQCVQNDHSLCQVVETGSCREQLQMADPLE